MRSAAEKQAANNEAPLTLFDTTVRQRNTWPGLRYQWVWFSGMLSKNVKDPWRLQRKVSALAFEFLTTQAFVAFWCILVFYNSLRNFHWRFMHGSCQWFVCVLLSPSGVGAGALGRAVSNSMKVIPLSRTNLRMNERTNQATNTQASKQAGRQASKQASTQADKQTNRKHRHTWKTTGEKNEDARNIWKEQKLWDFQSCSLRPLVWKLRVFLRIFLGKCGQNIIGIRWEEWKSPDQKIAKYSTSQVHDSCVPFFASLAAGAKATTRKRKPCFQRVHGKDSVSHCYCTFCSCLFKSDASNELRVG